MGHVRRDRAARVFARRRLGVIFATIVVAASPVLEAPVLAAPLPVDPSAVVDETVTPDGARVVERPAVPLALPAERGLPGAAGLDPSVGLRSVPKLEGLPADRTPAQATEITDWRTEHSKSTLNPDGSITAEYSGGRLNFLDAKGDWQPLDLSLIPASADGAYGVTVASSDRQVSFATKDVESALASIAGGDVRVTIRALDYPGVLANVDPPAETAAPTESPAPQIDEPTASPAASSEPAAPATPSVPSASPEPVAAPSPGPSAALSSAPVEPAASPQPSPEPSAAPSDRPSPEPSAAASAAPAPSTAPSPSATPAPTPTPEIGDIPAWVFDDSKVAFDGGANLGHLVANPTDDGFEVSVVLDDAASATDYAFALDLGDLEATLAADGRTVELNRVTFGEGAIDRTLAGVVRAPVLFDAKGATAPPEAVTVQLYAPGSGLVAPPGVSAAALASLGPTEILVAYSIDPAWIAQKDVTFPVTLDPSVCIQVGGSGCTSVGFEHYVGSGQPSTYPNPPSMVRVGQDAIGSPDAAWDQLRGLVYFGDVALPDGGQVISASLDLREKDNLDGTTAPRIQARLINKSWSWNTTYDDIQYAWEEPYNSLRYVPCDTGGTDCTLSMDVEKIVRAWYTRRGLDWKPNIGFYLFHSDADVGGHEVASWGETDFYLSTDASVGNRPKLTIDYFIPSIEMDFDAALGSTYAPSTMVAGKDTTLPLLIDNKSASAWGLCTPSSNTDCSSIGYRFFDAKGKLDSWGKVGPGGFITAGQLNAPLDLGITAPTTPGEYTLRLDYVRMDSGWLGTPVWASDYAQPSKYYSRNKKVLAADNTRWTGSSVIERDEFQVSVVSGGGTATGELRTVDLGDGGSLGIDLYSGNLHHEDDAGLGFNDLIPLDLTYGYDSKNAAFDDVAPYACGGILHACGWYTNWDERLTPHPTIYGTYFYQDASGNRHVVATDGNGQLISGAPALLERVRYTGFDEKRPYNGDVDNIPDTGPSLVSGAAEGVGTAGGGVNIYKVKANASTFLSGLGGVDLNAYHHAKWALRATSATTVNLSFRITNLTTGAINWYDTGATAPPTSSWGTTYWVDLYTAIRGNPTYGSLTDSFQVTGVTIESVGGTGYVYMDQLRFLAAEAQLVGDNEPAWTQNAGNGNLDTTDFTEGSKSLRIEPTTGALAPSCQSTCFTALDPATSNDGALYSQPFVSWQWRKVGGTSVAIEFNLKDARTAAVGQITYYAGPVPPPGATNPIQVSPTVPVNWTKVTRNVQEDGRQVLNFFNDNPTGSAPGAPPSQGPSPDEVIWLGVKPWAPDGSFAMVDDLRFASVPFPGDTTPAVANDYVATFADGSSHWFNEAGLLEEIRDRDDNAVTLDWTVVNTASLYDQDQYTLTSIHAASADTPYDRRIDVSHPGSDWTFEEKLGASITGRKAVFTVDSVTKNLTKVQPARESACAGSAPTGCPAFTYATGNHLLTRVADPRWDGSASGSADFRYDVAWSDPAQPTADVTSIADRSHGGAKLLTVVNYAVSTPSPAARRVLWQDAAAAALSYGQYTDLTSDGSVLYDYQPLACGGPPCNPSTSGLSNQKTTASEFDGLARVSTTYQYSLASASPTPLVSRQGSNAAAKVDNYNNPLAAGAGSWSQSPDQYFASIRDSDGKNRDLYRTFATNDDTGNQLTQTTLAYNARPDYAATAKSVIATTGNLKGYWRLGETSGTTAADAAPTPHAGTYAGSPALGGSGALVGDTDKAPTFDKSNDTVTVPTSLGAISAPFSVSVWARPSNTTDTMSILGSRGASEETFDLKFMAGNLVHADIGNGTAWLSTAADASLKYEADRWYHLTYVVTSSAWSAYVDGDIVATGAIGSGGKLTSTQSLVIGNPGFAGEPFGGQIDEVAVYGQALTAPQVQGLYLAGRSVAEHTSRTMYDREGHPIQIDDQFLASPGFESGLGDWEVTAPAATDASQTHPPIDPAQPPSLLSLSTGISGSVRQDAQLLPGQTFRFQVWDKRTSTVSAKVDISYWKRSTGAWTSLVSATYTDAAWTSHAWDMTLPFDTDGRVRVALSGTSGTGTAYFDDAALLTSYARTTYLGSGLTDFAYTFAASTGSAIGEIALHPVYASNSTHPAIFATSSTANYIDGVYSAANPDQDVTTSATYDAWGRTLTSTDPDGVVSTTHYRTTTGNGFQTDVDYARDGLANQTSFAYDLAGNPLTATSPMGVVTATTFDLAGNAVTTTSPDGVVNRNDYNSYGQLATSWANYVDGNPSGGAGLDDVKTSYTYDAFGRTTTTIANDAGGTAQSKSTTTFDLLGRATSASTWSTFDGTTFGGQRKTESRAAVFTPSGGTAITRPGMPGARGPGDGSMVGTLVPAGAPAPACPDGSGFCNAVSGQDLNGLAISTTDAYGKVARSFFDVAGRPVFAIANYGDGVYASTSPDVDIVSATQYDVGGRAAKSIDVLGRSSVQTFDALGRSIQTTSYDSGSVAVTKTKTAYTPGGRVDHVSRPAAYADADSAMAWTKTVYDGAGRALETIDHYDVTNPDAHWYQEGFEQAAVPSDWATSGAGIGWFVNTGATLSVDSHYNWVKPAGGRGRLRISTDGLTINEGVGWNLQGTFKAGRTYRVRGQLSGNNGHAATVYLGCGSGCTNPGQVFSTTGGWAYQQIDLSWTPAADSSVVKLAVRASDASPAAYSVYVDDLVLWDTTSADYWNVPSETVYDADGHAVESVLPPGDPAVDKPLVTETAYDPTGRVVGVSVNDRRELPAAILNSTSPDAYWPLDEPAGTVSDRDSAFDLTAGGSVQRGVAGAVAEGRTAVRLDGTTGSLSRATNVSALTDNFSAELWLRTDAPPAALATVLRNGDGANGWGIGVDTAGNAVGLYETANVTTTLATAKNVADGLWHHVALVRSAGTTTVYVDKTAYSVTNATTAPGTPGAATSLGRESAAGGYFAGDLDEVAVFDAAMSSTTVGSHYDAGRITTADANLATTTAYDRLGRATDSVDPTGTRTRFAFDRLGRTTATWLNYKDGSPTGPTADDDAKSTYAYDAAGELLAYCPARNVQSVDACDPTSTSTGTNAYKSAWHYAYDEAGHLTKQVPPVNVTAAALDTKFWVYDPGMRLTKSCDAPAGATSCSTADRNAVPTYDGVGRVTRLNTNTGSGTTLSLRTDTTYFGDGAVGSTTSSTGTTPTFSDRVDQTYDSAGRPDQLLRFNSAGVQLAVLSDNAWNGDGTLASRIDGDNAAIGTSVFTYDWSDRLATVDLPNTFSGAVPTFAWRADGLLGNRKWSIGSAAVVAYDNAKRPTSITKGTTTFGQAYDRDGNVTAESRSLPGVAGNAGSGSQSFTYDGLNRVTGSSGLASDSRAYTYDLDGNRLTETVNGTTKTSTFDRADQLVNVSGGGGPTAYAYDRYGNMTANAESVSSATAMTYDLADHLATIDGTGTANDARFSLDAVGRFRTRELGPIGSPTTTDTYSYAGPSETVLRIANSGGTTTDSIVSPSGDRLAVKQGTTLNWLLPDLHGNVAAAEDNSEATIVNATRYDAFGQALASGSGGGTAVAAATWTFQGRLDVSPAGLATPLYDLGARFYSPGIGAFTQLDSVLGSAQNPLSMNRFLYALANPATFVDPDGHAACAGWDDDCTAMRKSVMRHEQVRHQHWLRAKAAKGRASEREVENRSRRNHSGLTNGQIAARAAAQARVRAAATGHLKATGADARTRAAPSFAAESCEGVCFAARLAGSTAASAASGLFDTAASALGALACLICTTVNAGRAGFEFGMDPAGHVSKAAYSLAGGIGTARSDLLSGDPDRMGDVLGGILAFSAVAAAPAGVAGKAGQAESAISWANYPDPALIPTGPLRLLEGAEYDAARSAANVANRAIHREAGDLLRGLDIHEIHPVKFGGDPVSPLNKIALPRDIHSQFTSWWSDLQRQMENLADGD